jgi:hypothetical protein
MTPVASAVKVRVRGQARWFPTHSLQRTVRATRLAERRRRGQNAERTTSPAIMVTFRIPAPFPSTDPATRALNWKSAAPAPTQIIRRLRIAARGADKNLSGTCGDAAGDDVHRRTACPANDCCPHLGLGRLAGPIRLHPVVRHALSVGRTQPPTAGLVPVLVPLPTPTPTARRLRAHRPAAGTPRCCGACRPRQWRCEPSPWRSEPRSLRRDPRSGTQTRCDPADRRVAVSARP